VSHQLVPKDFTQGLSTPLRYAKSIPRYVLATFFLQAVAIIKIRKKNKIPNRFGEI